VGRTDGEGIERVWSWLNKIAYSVSMMLAGARLDTLDDFCSYNNFRKTRGLGEYLLKSPCNLDVLIFLDLENDLLRRMGKAIPMAIIHCRAFHSFSYGLKTEGNVDLSVWEKEICKWDEDMTKPSPYVMPDEGNPIVFPAISLDLIASDVKISLVKKKLLKQEHATAAKAGVDASLMEVTATSLIIAALEIEDLQCVPIFV
jgi:hypothetical protein